MSDDAPGRRLLRPVDLDETSRSCNLAAAPRLLEGHGAQVTVSMVRDGAGFAGVLDASIPVMRALASRLASGADRDDLVQDALLVAWRRRHTYDANRGTVQNWLLVIVIDQARKRRRRRSPELWPSVPDVAHTDRVVDIDLERAIAALPERQRLAVTLHYFCDLPIADVAAALGCAEGTAKSALARARRSLADSLGETT